MRKYLLVLAVVLLVSLLAACGAGEPEVLRLATTTSTADSGLLDAILPGFEAEHNARVDVVAVGTGQAIELGQAGDADVILVHARAREDAFVAEGHGLARYDVMYNDFILVGPTDDPAGVNGVTLAAEALATIAAAGAPFASRGDDSGTHTKELSLWETAGVTPDPAGGWYNSLGQGMGETLTFANEAGAYTLTDRGTFLSMSNSLPNLMVVVGGDSIEANADPALLNPYGVIPVNPDKSDAINGELAQAFVAWITSAEVQEQIGQFGVDTFGQPLFYPDAE
ncbi:ABC-type tungstate transport system permease component-like protein [Candidatus Promineifilum breve]|uniref:ABC-type tungstate transport system permease component-like protein n=1 Tax=Candidatus Promineifilum breve TaxID=1806508 RepID=A0A160T246_9CHLR|nr:substrate-binding domain-containing protein [Candidatus Promineifilum breve]CUS04151.2 ABC-type tungstate transport system permease component-like protein [Candidatus Promineifilum breve]